MKPIKDPDKLDKDISHDKAQIDEITKGFYGLFTNKNGAEPKIDSILNYCVAQSQIIKKTSDNQEFFSIDSFLKPRRILLTNGTLREFEEWEVAEKTTVDGRIAQRHSKYQKKGILNGVNFVQHGTKLFQYIKVGDCWKITSVIWEDETD